MSKLNYFELMREMDKLSELKETIEPKYIPIIEAKINYRLQQAYKQSEENIVVRTERSASR